MTLRNILLKTATRKFIATNVIRNVSTIHHFNSTLQHQNKAKLFLPNHACIRLLSTENTDTKHTDDSTNKDEKSSEDIKQEILDFSLDFVHEHGWSRKALSCGAVEAGYSGVTEGMFKNGGDDLVLYFVKKCNQQLDIYLKEKVKEIEESGKKLKISEFMRDALEFRLRMIIPYIDSWPQASPMLLKPSVGRQSVQELTNMIDNIWFYAGDKSADFNWYTKRGLLGKVYMSTQLVMLTDQSPDFEKTWDFLDRRITDINSIGKFMSNAQATSTVAFDVACEGLNILKTSLGFFDKKR